MDPATPTAAVKCPVDRCEYRPNVTDAALAATLLTIHAQSQHVDTPAPSRAAGATAKVEKMSRPTIDEGIFLEDWLLRESPVPTSLTSSKIAAIPRDYGRTSCGITVMRWPPAANEIYWPTLRSWRCAPRMQW